MEDLNCLNCGRAMVRMPYDRVWRCQSCQSAATTVAAARKLIDPKLVTQIWRWAAQIGVEAHRTCPGCGNRMHEACADEAALPKLDVCTHCQLIWFDANELDALPKLKPLSPEAEQALRLHKADLERDRPPILPEPSGSDYAIAAALVSFVRDLAAILFERNLRP